MDLRGSKRRILIIGDLCLSRYSLLPTLLSQNVSEEVEFYLTDLSDNDMKGRIERLLYDFVVYFVDMKSLRSWRIVEQAIVEHSSSFLVTHECVVINNSKK